MADDVLTMEPEGGVASDDVVVDKAEWVCVNCASHNPIDSDLCWHCQQPITPAMATDDDAADDAAAETPSLDDVKAGLQNLSGGVATAQDIENAARAEEGLPPKGQSELPLDFGPFNADNALKAIFEKQAEIKTLQADYDEKKTAAKEAKDELDKANRGLVAIIDSLKNRRQQALNPSQPYLRPVDDTAPVGTGCPWEQKHPGQTCPICSAAKAVGIQQPAVESPVHPEHEQHEATAEGAHVQNVLEPLKAKLEKVNLYVETSELQTLTTEDLEALRSFADEPTTIPPQIMARTCVADAPGSLVQICSTCGISLRTEIDNVDENREFWFPEGARVGFDCEGPKAVMVPDNVVVETHEVADESKTKPRYTRRHADPKKKAKAGKKARR